MTVESTPWGKKLLIEHHLEILSLKWLPRLVLATTWDFQQWGMCVQQSLRSACAYRQSDQSFCLSLEYYMTVKLLTEHHLETLSLKMTAQARLSLHLSKCHIVGNHLSGLKCGIEWWVRKIIHHLLEGVIKKICPLGSMSSLSKPCDAKWWSSGRFFYSPLTLVIDYYNFFI